MSIVKRKNSPYYWTRFSVNGIRVEESTKTANRAQAKEYEIKRKKELIDESMYGKTPQKSWEEATKRWLLERKSKRTISQDEKKFEYINKQFKGLNLTDITMQVVEKLVFKKEKDGVTPATINRMLALIKSVLNRACKHWEWIDKVPYIQMREEQAERIRWLTRTEAARLIECSPPHLKHMILFTLETGLRASNVLNLKWDQIDFEAGILKIDGARFKSKKNFVVPITKKALSLLKELKNNGHEYVFTFNGNRIKQCNTRAFRNALKRANIQNFRWHDLRHTWASWHTQNNMPIEILKQLGGWSSLDMVLKYAHISKEQLRKAIGIENTENCALLEDELGHFYGHTKEEESKDVT